MSPSLVALHGFTGSPESFRRVLAELPPDLPNLLPTLLGHDGTPGPSAVPDATSFETEVDRLAAGLSAEQHYLVGYSLGARLALGLLCRHRHRFRGALLIGANPGLEDPSERAARLVADEAWCGILEERGLEAFIELWQAQPLFASQSALVEERLAEQYRLRLRHDARGLACALRHLGLGRMPNYMPVLPELRLPIVFLVGSLDTKFAGLSLAMAARLPEATVVTVPGVGHNVVLERPDRVARAVIEGIAA